MMNLTDVYKIEWEKYRVYNKNLFPIAKAYKIKGHSFKIWGRRFWMESEEKIFTYRLVGTWKGLPL